MMQPCMTPLLTTAMQAVVGGGHRDLPLALRMGMTDVVASLDDFARASTAYLAETDRVYAVDEPRRWRSRAGSLLLAEGSGTQLVARDMTTWTDAAGRVTNLGSDTFRIVKTAGSGFSIRNLYALGNPRAMRFQARLISGSIISDDYIGLVNSSTPVDSVPISSLTSEWQDFDAVAMTDTDRAVILGRADSAWTIEIRQGIQVGPSPYPTSWIPGPGTARAADDAVIDLGANALPATGWTAMITGRPLWTPAITTKQPTLASFWENNSNGVTDAQVEVLQNGIGADVIRLAVRNPDGYFTQSPAAWGPAPSKWQSVGIRVESGTTYLRIYEKGAVTRNFSLARVPNNPLRYIGVGMRADKSLRWDRTVAFKLGRTELSDATMAAIAADELARLPS